MTRVLGESDSTCNDCLGGGMSELKMSVKRVFDSITDNKLNKSSKRSAKDCSLGK